MTDREWWDSLPPDAEFLTPAGECGGLFLPQNRGGLRCRPTTNEDYETAYPENDPVPDDYGAVDVWAGGVIIVPLATLRTWERYEEDETV